jgi:thiamine-phosphate pyrophosphorylase
VGQDDLPASTARKLLGQNKILGVSATSLQQAISAEEQGADYIGVGPIFDAKSTKPDAEPAIGVDLLREIKLKCTVPIVAIGGIKLDNIADVFQHGADCIAIISAIVASSNITQTTRDFIAKIKSLG